MSRRAHKWTPVLAYMAGLFALSSISNPPGLPGQPSDKLVHAVLYAGLGSVSLRAVVDRRWSRITPRRVLDAVLIAVAYGAFDEFHQSLVAGRQSDFADLIADTIGALTSAVALWLWSILLVKNMEGISNTEHRTSNTNSDETSRQ